MVLDDESIPLAVLLGTAGRAHAHRVEIQIAEAGRQRRQGPKM